MRTRQIEIPAQTLTTSPVAVLGTDFELDSLVFTNYTSSPVTVTCLDPFGKYVFTASIAPNSTQQFPFTLNGPVQESQYVNGGMTWQASANTAVDARLMARI